MFKTILKDNFEIAEYIETTSVCTVDSRLIEEYFFGCFAILKEVSIELLQISDEDCHLINTKKKKK